MKFNIYLIVFVALLGLTGCNISTTKTDKPLSLFVSGSCTTIRNNVAIVSIALPKTFISSHHTNINYSKEIANDLKKINSFNVHEYSSDLSASTNKAKTDKSYLSSFSERILINTEIKVVNNKPSILLQILDLKENKYLYGWVVPLVGISDNKDYSTSHNLSKHIIECLSHS